MTPQKAILIIVTSHDRIDAAHKTGLWFEEFEIPYRLFRAQGYKIIVASPKGGPTPLDPHNIPEDIESADTRAALQALDNTVPMTDISVEHFDAIFFPGGHGTMYDLPDNPDVIRAINQCAAQGKVIAAVCHGPAAFIGAALSDGAPFVKGRKLTMFSNEEEQAVALANLMPFMLESKLGELGAQLITAPSWQDHCVVDGKLVTGQNPQSSSSVANAVIKLLADS